MCNSLSLVCPLGSGLYSHRAPFTHKHSVQAEAGQHREYYIPKKTNLITAQVFFAVGWSKHLIVLGVWQCWGAMACQVLFPKKHSWLINIWMAGARARECRSGPTGQEEKNIVENEGGRPLFMFQWTTRSLHRPNPGTVFFPLRPPSPNPGTLRPVLPQSPILQLLLGNMYLFSWAVTCFILCAVNFWQG